ncbi:MAG: UbiH/UbiF/VisC/COQ6 family ubiquinone biosynthesis hydroxylase [Porticoccus sp.]|nr:UbiH/UbiF/VisC/COQ6 family ubiquinone biosynthesis hydroxylase [Porticoccus sp.]MBQ0808323.1 UbiH/UbiF/VisC/COQ6 family ubiquinone biosynthesis hydroxylase [Porticoccus sp.]
MAEHEYDVVVSGAGMVGAAFAALLATTEHGKNLRIAVLEARPFVMPDLSKSFDPRVVALTALSRKLLEDTGAWEQIAARRVCPYQRMEVWEADGTGHIEFDCAEVRQPSLGHIVENALVVEALWQRLEALENVTLLCPATVVDLDRQPEGVAISLADGSVINTKLLAAADGAQSKVRELCGLQLRQWEYGHHAIVTTVTTEKNHDFTARQRFLPEGPLAFLPLQTETGDCHQCSIVWSQQADVAEQLMALDDDAFCETLTRAGENCLGNVVAVDKRYKIPLKQRHAVDYVVPGVALMGDAAHTIHPLAGQGVNLGFQDVIVLVEEVERAVSRGLSPGDMWALGRYQRRRKPHNLGTMAVMEGFKRLFEKQPLPVRLLRNDGMNTVNRLGPIKNLMVRQAMGLL